jgi:hypothetical protein
MAWCSLTPSVDNPAIQHGLDLGPQHTKQQKRSHNGDSRWMLLASGGTVKVGVAVQRGKKPATRKPRGRDERRARLAWRKSHDVLARR